MYFGQAGLSVIVPPLTMISPALAANLMTR